MNSKKWTEVSSDIFSKFWRFQAEGAIQNGIVVNWETSLLWLNDKFKMQNYLVKGQDWMKVFIQIWPYYLVCNSLQTISRIAIHKDSVKEAKLVGGPGGSWAEVHKMIWYDVSGITLQQVRYQENYYVQNK